MLKLLRQRRLLAAAAAIGSLGLAACQEDQPTLVIPGEGLAAEAVLAGFDFSTVTGGPGNRITVALRMAAPLGVQIAATQGSIRFDRSALSFAGQIADVGGAVALLNSDRADQGLLRFGAFEGRPVGLGEQVVVLAFDVLRGGYDRSFFVDVEVLKNAGLENLDYRFVAGDMDATLPSGDAARNIAFADWVSAKTNGRPGNLFRTGPGQATVFGDGNASGDSDITDALNAARIGVDNPAATCFNDPLLATNQDCKSLNVAPKNNTGAASGGSDLGDGLDPCAPGLELCSNPFSRVVDVSDALLIAQCDVGNPLCAIAGQAIPTVAMSADTVCVMPFGQAFTKANPASCTGDDRFLYRTTDLTLDNDRVWVLDHEMRIGADGTGNVDALGAGGTVAQATLTIEQGTTVLGRDSAAIIVTRAGRIEANGSEYAPITFTCLTDEASEPRPQCWRGVLLAGNAPVNQAFGGTTPAMPTIPGRNSGGAGNQFRAEGFPGGDVFYGGTNPSDDGGTIRYARILYGGFLLLANNELNGLTLATCGTGTQIEFVQIQLGSDDGLELFGGDCSPRGIYSVANEDDQIDWSLGYDGDLQFMVIQQAGDTPGGGGTDTGFEVDGVETGTCTAGNANDDRDHVAAVDVGCTNARVSNVTMVGGSTNGATETNLYRAFRFRKGVLGDTRNLIAVNYNQVYLYQGALCTTDPDGQLGVGLNFTNIAALGYTTLYETNSDAEPECEEQAHIERVGGQNINQASYAASPFKLVAPFSISAPDYKPIGNGLFGQTAASLQTPTGMLAGSYYGALDPAKVSWLHGWTVGR